MNMESLSLQIAREHIELMTEDNLKDDCFLEEGVSINNIKNGFVVITQVSAFIESYLNTIINCCMCYTGEILLKCSIDEKLEMIFMHYNKDLGEIKSQHPWEVYRKTTSARNELIHYKKKYIGHGSDIPNFNIGKVTVREFFTKSSMEEVLDNYIELAKLIASKLGLQINESLEIFTCDGTGDAIYYVCEKQVDKWS